MARDEAILASFGPFNNTPTLRLYEWARPTISIGYGQKAAPIAARAPELPLVRRITGGRAVLHEDEITYSVVSLTTHPLFSAGIEAAYSVISRAIVEALISIGVEASLSKGVRRATGKGTADEACFNAPSRYEVMASGRKIAGSAQRRYHEKFIQHGSILYGADDALNAKLFGPAVTKSMTSVSALSKAPKPLLREALTRAFAGALGAAFFESALSGEEEQRAVRLAKEKRLSAPRAPAASMS